MININEPCSSIKRLNSLPNNKVSDCSKLKAFADDKINVTEKVKFVLEELKTFWERRKCWLPKGFLYRVIKSLDCVVNS